MQYTPPGRTNLLLFLCRRFAWHAMEHPPRPARDPALIRDEQVDLLGGPLELQERLRRRRPGREFDGSRCEEQPASRDYLPGTRNDCARLAQFVIDGRKAVLQRSEVGKNSVSLPDRAFAFELQLGICCGREPRLGGSLAHLSQLTVGNCGSGRC